MDPPTMLAALFLLQLFRCSYAAEQDFYVYPTILQERTRSGNLILRLTNNLTLSLEKSSVLADKLLLVTSSREGHRTDTVDTSAIQEVLYQDVHHQSSLVLRQREGVVQVEGIINHELRIKPLPQDERSLQDRILHKIYKVEEIKGTYMNMEPMLSQVYQRSDGPFQRKRTDRRNPDSHHSRRDQEEERTGQPEKFTVELHTISDSVHQKEFKTNEELIAYLAVMTNAVNLRYLDMKNPRISFILVGLTRSKDDPFVSHKGGYLYAAGTLSGMEAYNKEGKIPGNPDLVYLVTGQDVARDKEGGGGMDPGVSGIGRIGGICSKSFVGAGEDIAKTYKGTRTMAHELAHMKLKPECIEVKAKHNYQKDHRKFPGQTLRQEFYCRSIWKLKKHDQTKVIVRKDPLLTKKCKMECCRIAFGRATCRVVIIPAGMECARGKTCKRGVCGVHTWE
ncbi:venom metalloproteinase antarease TserMP_A-like isoform X4 [Dermacentor andersoni]|uniref:venom metalloproteinase antarease TserMP_A-like isoform X4 n=1 Tax=Dermacentor andersoni TaxID=34620 RepID=UPI002417593E|nr:venom metalloproteinase antarease TserMP_A-like isoform X4 [Dermacentor andersoni]